MNLKSVVLSVSIVASLSACGSNDDDAVVLPTDTSASTSRALVGMWLSNCHEFSGTEDASGNNLYNVSELSFTETEYVDRFTSYTDINCTENPVEESSSFSYTTGDMVSTTDGVTATRITVIPLLPDGSDSGIVVEAIYRITGVELNFGEFTGNEVPGINLNPTYTKQ